ncbi:aldolase [Suillus occidentalis]|nr:aldolase [Suillus occidentalis]
MANSLLSQIQALGVVVDIDSMDHKAAKSLSVSTTFHSMTSNQAIVNGQLQVQWDANLEPLVSQYVQDALIDISTEDGILEVLNLVTVLLASKVIPYLDKTGRVLAQTSPRTAYDKDATVAHAKALVNVFGKHGISRVCIKIPVTPQSILACKELEESGIRTLGTCLFSVPQAMAASQAGCLSISPYFNELRVHFPEGASSYIKYSDPVRQHPMSPIIYSIIQTFKERQTSTTVVPASIITVEEAVALARLRPHHLTISDRVLALLADAPGRSDDELAAVTFKVTEEKSVFDADYLSNNAAALQIALSDDPETSRKIKEALEIFGRLEKESIQFLRKALSAHEA